MDRFIITEPLDREAGREEFNKYELMELLSDTISDWLYKNDKDWANLTLTDSKSGKIIDCITISKK